MLNVSKLFQLDNDILRSALELPVQIQSQTLRIEMCTFQGIHCAAEGQRNVLPFVNRKLIIEEEAGKLETVITNDSFFELVPVANRKQNCVACDTQLLSAVDLGAKHLFVHLLNILLGCTM